MVLENGVRLSLLEWLKFGMISNAYDAVRNQKFYFLAGERDGSEIWDTGAQKIVGPESDDIVLLQRGQIARASVDGELSSDEGETRIPKLEELSSDLLAFFHDRLKVHLKDEGIRHDIIDAALAKPPADDLFLVVARARALAAFLATPDGENLVQGYRRAANILHQAEAADGVEYRYGADVKFAETDEERALFAALATAEAAIKPALKSEDFAAAMTQMARLRAPIDAFFDAVQVNADNQILRRNRLNLLHRIVETCGAVADLSRIEG
jgi:glycyl-tRNA synthetase beta chain